MDNNCKHIRQYNAIDKCVNKNSYPYIYARTRTQICQLSTTLQDESAHMKWEFYVHFKKKYKIHPRTCILKTLENEAARHNYILHKFEWRIGSWKYLKNQASSKPHITSYLQAIQSNYARNGFETALEIADLR